MCPRYSLRRRSLPTSANWIRLLTARSCAMKGEKAESLHFWDSRAEILPKPSLKNMIIPIWEQAKLG